MNNESNEQGDRKVGASRDRNDNESAPFPPTKFFGRDVRRYLSMKQQEHDQQQQQHHDDESVTDESIDFGDIMLRQVMEPHIAKARQGRTKAFADVQSVPYPALRRLQRLHFSQEQFPFRQTLEMLLDTDDLAQLHANHDTAVLQTKKDILKPLLEASSRDPFHQIYERFVCDFIVPYLHKRVVDEKETCKDRRLYFRYQAFPCIRVVRPGEFSIGPHCDLAYGHSIASLNFYVPLSAPIMGTNAIYLETQPDGEDWQPLLYPNGNEGVAVLFDGVECLHFTLENMTPFTRVSLDFRVSVSDYDDVKSLHESRDWQDRYSSPAGYYAFCQSSQSGDSDEIKVQRLGERPDTIDRRVGFPF